MADDTSIRVSPELAEELYQRKGRGTSYEDYLWDVLDRLDELEEASNDSEATDTENTTDRREPQSVNNQPISEDDPREILESMDLPGSGEDHERRVESVLEIYDELRSNPGVRMSKSDFRELLEDQDVGYSGGFGSLWSNWVKSNPAQGHGENVLASLPGVELRGNDYIYQKQS